MLVAGVEIVDDVLEEEMEDGPAVVDALDGLEAPLEGRDDSDPSRWLPRDRPGSSIRPGLRSYRVLTVPVTMSWRRSSGSTSSKARTIASWKVGKLELAGPDELMDQKEALGREALRYPLEQRVELLDVVERHVHENDVVALQRGLEAMEVELVEVDAVDAAAGGVAASFVEGRGGEIDGVEVGEEVRLGGEDLLVGRAAADAQPAARRGDPRGGGPGRSAN